MRKAVHEIGGKIILQLGYDGAYPSKTRLRKMTPRNIQDLVQAYALAAIRAQKAGFDGVQIFAAHGFFLSQLLCPRYNDRTDDYGGKIANRARVLLEVLHAVRYAVDRDYPVLVKLNCRDFVENGLTLEDSLRVGRMLEKGGVDAIELSGGLLNNPNIMRSNINFNNNEAFFQNEAQVFKEKIRVPLILVGGIRSYHSDQRLVNEDIADYISMSRPFIREPELINRWKAGDLREAVCISCDNCFETIKKGQGVTCVPVEPQVAKTFLSTYRKLYPPVHPTHPARAIKFQLGWRIGIQTMFR